MRSRPKYDAYRSDRENGMTYREIAEKHGVSRQYVAQVLGKQSVPLFRYNTSCVYPVIRKWMNENQVTIAEIVRRMDLLPIAENYIRYRDILCGKTEPKKSFIDFMIRLTGLTYEELFREEDNGEE